MAEININCYEGLFLFPQAASADLGSSVEHVEELLRRSDAEVLSLSKWDERRLAYDVKGNKRGVFLLAYFKAPTNRLVDLERDCNLSEKLLRAMIVRADHLTEEQMSATEGRQAVHEEIAKKNADEAAAAKPAPTTTAAPAAAAATAPAPKSAVAEAKPASVTTAPSAPPAATTPAPESAVATEEAPAPAPTPDADAGAGTETT